MSTPMTTYVVDAYDSKEKVWKTVLSTKDRAEAEAMKEAMEQDGVRARLSEFRAKKR
jgi:spore coat polysaccharide biosynthesis protein SpsF (cytidylyltransferase family)